LTDKLAQGFTWKIAVLMAPLGYGKTSLLIDWVKQISLKPTGKTNIAWYSIDEEDNDPQRFFSYLIASVQEVNQGTGQTALLMLSNLSLYPLESVLIAFINDIQSLPFRLVIILDDYHQIKSPIIHRLIAFLIEHIPSNLHIVFAARTEPPLTFARLRAKGALMEIGTVDLRFNQPEVMQFFHQYPDLSLSEMQISTLGARTEGWIAGLQLAMASLRNSSDVSAFIEKFSGSHRFIQDFFLDEVFFHQPRITQDFLLKTSILKRFTGLLCDTLTGQQDGNTVLEDLERANLFLVPLDDQRNWYRYQNLFAEMLQARLQKTYPQMILDLHQKASKWFAMNNFKAEAIEHAIAGQDYASALEIIESYGFSLSFQVGNMALHSWQISLPEELVRTSPRLLLTYAWEGILTGEIRMVERRLADVENCLQTEKTPRLPAEVNRFLGEISGIRACLGVIFEDVDMAILEAEKALSYIGTDNPDMEAAIQNILGDAYFVAGRLEYAIQAYRQAMEISQARGEWLIWMIHAVNLGNLQLMQGKLVEAEKTLQRILIRIPVSQRDYLPARGKLLAHLGEINRQQNDLSAAKNNLREAIELLSLEGYIKHLVKGYASLSLVTQAEGNSITSTAAIENAARSAQTIHISRLAAWVQAQAVRLCLLQGKLQTALEWKREKIQLLNENTRYLDEFEQLTLVRVFLAESRLPGVHVDLTGCMRMLEKMLVSAQQTERPGSVAEISLMQALIHDHNHRHDQALFAIQRSLNLASQENYVRLFLDEGLPAAKILNQAIAQGIMVDFCIRLIKLFRGNGYTLAPLPEEVGTLSGVMLKEPLTDREIDVLSLLGQGDTNKEIALRLYIAESTVKKHVSSILTKLGIDSRRQAVQWARSTGLLPKK
jgi:LuxR family transcriptional regulator, maltose regulon positive regulatory protein